MTIFYLSSFPVHQKQVKDKKEEKLSKLKASTYSATDTQKEALLTEKEDTSKIEPVETRSVPLVDQIKKWIFVFGILFLVIFCFKNYFLKINPRVRGQNGKKISPDHSEVRRNKVRLIVSKFVRVFFSYLRRIAKPKEAKSVEGAKKNILKKIRKLQKGSS